MPFTLPRDKRSYKVPHRKGPDHEALSRVASFPICIAADTDQILHRNRPDTVFRDIGGHRPGAGIRSLTLRGDAPPLAQPRQGGPVGHIGGAVFLLLRLAIRLGASFAARRLRALHELAPSSCLCSSAGVGG